MVFDGESSPYGDDAQCKAKNAYGRTKALMEEGLRANGTLRSIILRSSNILGPPAPYTGKGKFLQWLTGALEEKHRMEVSSDRGVTLWSDEFRNFIWVDDIVKIVASIVEQAKAGTGDILPTEGNLTRIFNMGGPEALSRVDVGNKLCVAMDVACSLIIPVVRYGPGSQVLDVPRDLSFTHPQLFIITNVTPTTIDAGIASCTNTLGQQTDRGVDAI